MRIHFVRPAVLLFVLWLSLPAVASTLTVTNTNDSGTGSLRQAIADAATSGDTIQFQFTTTPATISLTSGDLHIDKNLTITGPGATNLIIDASGNIGKDRVFTVVSGVTASISGLTAKNGGGGRTGSGSLNGDGGGIYNVGNLTLTNVVVSNSTTSDTGTGAGGGGIYNNGTLALVGCTVSSNTAGSKTSVGTNFVTGGAIRNSSNGTLTVTDSTISSNFSQQGGGIFNVGSMTVTGSTFISNSAGVGITNTTAILEGGAIFFNPQSSGTIVNSTFSGNAAHDNGGAIANNGAVSVSFSTFSGNSAPNGNGVSATKNTVTLKGNIFSNNGTNCLISGGSIVSDGYNLATDGSCNLTATGDLPNTAAGLDPSGLQSNGGSTKTIALLSTSAAVDKIPTPCTDAGGNAVATDQRGTARPQGTNCDIGAFELQPSSSGTTVTNTNDTGPGSLRAAIANANAGDTVDFNLTYPATITLTGQILVGVDLRIDKNLTIRGPGASNLTINGNGAAQVFLITSGVTASISGLTLTNGKNDNGGAVGNNGTLNLSSCVVSGSSSGQGAGINNQSTGVLTVTNCTISGNTASGFGGGILNNGTATVTGSTLSSNTAAEAAGIYNGTTGTLTLTNSTLANNEETTRGGALENQSTMHVSNSTLFNNSSPEIAGGIYNINGTTTIKGTIVAKASAGDNCAGSFISQGYNLSDDASCGFSDPTDLNSTAAGLNAGGLQDNGGPTQTIALQANSAAVNAILTASCTDVDGNAVATDQRGVSRPQGSACDIGAFELEQSSTNTVTNTNDSGSGSLRDAIANAQAGAIIDFNLTYPTTITLTGGVLTIDKNLTIRGPGFSNLAISGNNSSASGGSRIFDIVSGVSASITGVTLENGNDANDIGGAVVNTGTLNLSDCVLSGNYGIKGGALTNDAIGTLALTNCTVSGNFASNLGAGLLNYGTATVTASTFSRNNAAEAAGAFNAGTLTIINSTFADNQATTYEGALANDYILHVSNTTFYNNSAGSPSFPGGLFNYPDPASTSTIKGTLFAKGSAGNNCGSAGGMIVSQGHNLADDSSCSTYFTDSTDKNNTSAGLDTNGLLDNGGPTQTVALLANSAGLDAIPTASCSDVDGNTVAVDQRGTTRPHGAGCDIGAFELVLSQPTITNFSPTSGLPGTSVTITGTDFTAASSVSFNNSSATTLTVDSDKQITATVPAGATTGAVAVTTAAGTATSSTNFTVNPPPPSITSFTPTSGGIGATVTISGSAFTGTSAVKFNGTTASFTVNSDTQITATVPSGATTGLISVTTAGGTVTSASNFLVVSNTPPTITGFSPTSGPIGTAVTVSGANLKGATQVSFNGASATFKFSGMKIIATVSAGATSGPIWVTTPGGIASSGANFIVVSAPTITGFSPPNGPAGTHVTISGTNFTGVSSVMFGGKSATFSVLDLQTISATVPKGAKSAPISVTTPAGKVTSSTSFVVN